ncbi:MAG: hypothetical protein ACREEW_06380 [Caulobacteraceae bacterium]
MADTTLTLGLVTFQDFEIPGEIAFGGGQALSVKKLVGGARVVDALGQDDAEIGWRGRFQSPDALDRALSLDEMRKGGQAQTLTVAGLSYAVVVSRFTFRVQRLYQVLYEIALAVVQDNTLAPPASSATLDDVVGADMGSAETLLPIVTDPSVAPALASLQGAIAGVGTLQGATLTALAPVAAAAAQATSAIEASIAAVDPTILSDTGSVAGIVSGGDAAAMVAAFQAQSAALAEEASLRGLVALTSRIETNLAQATG